MAVACAQLRPLTQIDKKGRRFAAADIPDELQYAHSCVPNVAREAVCLVTGAFASTLENVMAQKSPHPTLADLADFEFDGTQLVELKADHEISGSAEFHMLERGSEEHIAFLEHILGQLQATLDELRAQRTKRAD